MDKTNSNNFVEFENTFVYAHEPSKIFIGSDHGQSNIKYIYYECMYL